MSQVSRPLLAVLVAAVAFLGVWLVALKPSASTSSGSTRPAASAPGVAGLQRAIDKAHKAVGTSSAASAAHGGTIARTPTRATGSATTSATPKQSATPAAGATRVATKPSPSSQSGHSVTPVEVVSRALAANKVLALLFYNPTGSDDRAVQQELAAVPLYGGRVVELAIPLADLASYPVVTTQVPVAASPTLVVVDPHKRATMIAGFADRFEIGQRISDALQAR